MTPAIPWRLGHTSVAAHERVMYRRILYGAIGSASASTATVWAYYHSVPIDVAANTRGLLVWYLTALLVSLGLGSLGYWLVLRAGRSALSAFRWALVIMIAATVVMLVAEFTVTWSSRAMPTAATAIEQAG